MEEKTFTKEQLDEAILNAKNEWLENELNPIIAERDDLVQYKPIEKSESELAIEQREQELIQKEINIELKSAGLDQFAEFFNVQNVEELKPKIEQFQSIMNEMKIENSYKPTDHKKSDAYTNAKQKGDALGMIKSLFA